MLLSDFFLRAIVVSFCISLVLYLFYPRYEFIDSNNRVDKVSGKSEYYSGHIATRGWHEY